MTFKTVQISSEIKTIRHRFKNESVLERYKRVLKLHAIEVKLKQRVSVLFQFHFSCAVTSDSLTNNTCKMWMRQMTATHLMEDTYHLN